MRNREEAWAALHRSGTSAAELAQICHQYPEFAQAAAQHPNAYQALREWAAHVVTIEQNPSAPQEPERSSFDPLRNGASENRPATTRWLSVAAILWTTALVLHTVPFIFMLAIHSDSGPAIWAFPICAQFLAYTACAIAALLSSSSRGRRIAGMLLPVLILAGSLSLLLLQGDSGPVLWLGYWLGSLLLFVSWALAWPIHGAGWAAISFPAFGLLTSIVQFLLLPHFLLIIGVVCALWWSRGSERRAALYAAQAEELRMARAHTTTVIAVKSVGGGPDQYVALPGGYGPLGAPTRTSTLAIVAFVLSFLVALVGAILGHVALAGIKRTGEGGRGLAIAAIVIGYTSFLLSIVLLLILMGIWTSSITSSLSSSLLNY